ncbi:LytTR family transcriptional regulator DNA-binding domain-containing protein [Winogradskyella flava]|uniref:LytTR family transcriptional regulator DNA-binding domain-containing protein n=1 Tax=Winogradskyella flava TaxID=1884876 RepID=UPI0024903045|nr:LytTR family DNA-binding domain-containing protein [Winogradskyella flava]
MNAKTIKSILLNKEFWLHTVLWTLFFASINVNWTQSWISESFLPEAVAPHSAIAVPALFLLNVFWLIPNYLSKKRWLKYIWLSLSLLVGFEILRTLLFTTVLHEPGMFVATFKTELFGENSLIFGFLNVLTLNSIFYSFVYRFTRDWLINRSIIETLKFENQQLQFVGYSQLAKDDAADASTFSNLENKIELKTKKKTLIVKKRNGVFLLKISDIVFFQAQGDFVFAFDAFGNKHIVNESLKSIKSQVCEHQFHQINRGEIINFDYITKFDSYTKNRLEISFKGISEVLYTSNSRSAEFKQWINQH